MICACGTSSAPTGAQLRCGSAVHAAIRYLAEENDVNEISAKNEKYLLCERDWVYYTLITVSGFWGAFTYLLRGHAFCSGQTGNILLMGMALGSGEVRRALYYLVPISAYIAGAFISEIVPNTVKHNLFIRWDTLLIGIEILVVILLGFVPDEYPVQISQVAVNFIASMQYNTFRQAQGTPMATTFATNHVRQVGIGLAKELHHRRSTDKTHRVKLKKHSGMILMFIVGAAVGAMCCNLLGGRAIWLTALPLSVLFAAMLNDDRIRGQETLEQKPSGH